MDSEAVALAGTDARQVAVPVQCPPLVDLDPRLFAVVVEEAQLDCLSVL
jgi:hypothetical protein